MNHLTEEEIFAAAIQKPIGERAEFLDRACAGNAALRNQVEALLAAHDKPDSFLEVPAAAVATIEHEPAPPPSESLGMQIGPYKLLQKLGEGGMGTVWVAEQERPVKRRVALKVIKAGMDSAQVIARFEAERQALAIMDHTNIAKVLDAGTIGEVRNAEFRVRNKEASTSSAVIPHSALRTPHLPTGRPYFVMELVKGVPITKYCDELNLPIRERLALFIPVCQAIQHAHQKGIIHRDLKPSNILVAMQDGRPVPKVIDFGVAKALHQPLTERTMMTEFGAVVGTLEYMSPEQAELSALDIDTRADIYALGVLLYELLTGSTPLDRKRLRTAALDEMLRIIREDEPPRPSTRLTSSENLASLAAHRRTEPRKLGAEVRGELDWIVMKALEKDRTRRYETANSFARDVERFLSDEPVEACPPSTAYRLRKFAKKHFAALSTAAAFALVLVLASVISVAQAIRAIRAEEQANIQRDAAASAAEQAQTARTQAESDRDRAVTAEQLASERLAQVTTEKERAQRAESSAADEAAIAKAVNEFLQSDLLAQADLYTQDRAAMQPDRDVKLRTVLDRAAARVSGRFTKQPLVESSLRLTIGQAYFSLAEYGPAREHLQRALEICQQDLGAEHPDTLAVMNALALVYSWDGKFAEGEKLFLKAADGRRKILGAEHPDTLTTLFGLSEMYSHWKPAEVEPLILQVLEGRRKVLGDEHPDTLISLFGLGMTYALQRKFEQAEPLVLKALEGQRRVLGNEHPNTLMNAGSLGWLYLLWKKHVQAEAILSQNLEDMWKVMGPDHPLTLNTEHNLAAVYWDQGKLDQSEQLFARAMEGYRKVRSGDHPHTLINMSYLARLYQARGKDALAESLFAELLEARRRAYGLNHTAIAFAASDLADSLIRQKKFNQAEPLLTESLAIYDQKAPDAWTRFFSQSLLGGLRLGRQQYRDAEPLLLAGYKGLEQRQSLIPERYQHRLPEALQRLINLYMAWEKPDEAGKWRKILEEHKAVEAPAAKGTE